ncbi:MAG: hypothetical protein ACXVZP_04425 [Gaiellaceae bacterium]
MRARQPWWASAGRPVAGRATHALASRDVVGEPVWLPAVAVLSAAALYGTLPARFINGSSAGAFSVFRWIVPALAVALLAPLALTAPRRRFVHGVARRTLALALIALVTAANAAAIILLVHLLVNGASTHANELLRAGIHMWCMNVIVFGLWFWQLDGGGPAARATGTPQPDFLFPQTAMPELAEGWRPVFLDYLYVSFTNATAFSPTDTMPLSRWAKVLMMLQSAASLLLAIMVAARAINILH